MINKVIILAGGKGTRISEESKVKPKPMVLIGEDPIIEHIMNIYNKFGDFEFLVACGYKQEVIKEYFQEKFDPDSRDGNKFRIKENSYITLIDTGLDSMTGYRIKQILEKYEDENFHLTYGDGLAPVDINQLTDFHFKKGKLATVTAVRPPSRFGLLKIENEQVTQFGEKKQTLEGWINGGFFCINRGVLDYLNDDINEPWESRPLENLAKDNELSAFLHKDFWQPMDTMREKEMLDNLWKTGEAPWVK